MALRIDTARALRRPVDIEALVQAVIAGQDEDEAEWIEWKSTLDLNTTEGQFSLARQILGSANRMPDQAARFVEGLGYIVVGAEPGSVQGVAPVDVAKLGGSLEKYLGNPGPVWTAVYVEVHAKQVLVVTVEAPHYGDRMHSLAKEFQSPKGGGSPAGTVFIRKQARTVPAGPGDIRALEDRFARGLREEQALDLQVEWPGRRLHTLDVSDAAVDEWLGLRREAVLAMKPSAEAAPASQPSFTAIAMAGFFRDTRTDEEYEAEVEEHLTECSKRLVSATIHEAAQQRLTVVELRVTNSTARNLPGVELVLTIPAGPVSVYVLGDDHDWELPAPPKAKGTRLPGGLFGPMMTSPSLAALSIGGLGLEQSITRTLARGTDSRVHITRGRPATKVALQVGDLRPHGSRLAPPFLLVTAAEPGSSLALHWSATSTRVDATQEGELTFPVSETALKPADVIEPDAGIAID